MCSIHVILIDAQSTNSKYCSVPIREYWEFPLGWQSRDHEGGPWAFVYDSLNQNLIVTREEKEVHTAFHCPTWPLMARYALPDRMLWLVSPLRGDRSVGGHCCGLHLADADSAHDWVMHLFEMGCAIIPYSNLCVVMPDHQYCTAFG